MQRHVCSVPCSVAFSIAVVMAVAVTRVGCRVVLSVLEGKSSAIQRKRDNCEVLLFSLTTITMIFIVFYYGGYMFRVQSPFTPPLLTSLPSLHTPQL